MWQRGAVRFHHVAIDRQRPVLDDVAATTDETLGACGVVIAPGAEVAIAVGSRGIRDLTTVVARVAAWVSSQDATAFLVPAMGSHGGATAEGQAEVLRSYGLGELGLEIRASMEVVELPCGDLPVPVVFDAAAARADATVVVNRVKPHTDFHDRYESGVMKMAAIGLGKRTQAEALHAFGVHGLRALMPRVARQVLDHANVVLGVAIVENSRDETMLVEAIPAAAVPEREPELLAIAAANMPRLPIDELDVLLIDRMGKDISGVGMDTNVIGRIMIDGEPDPPTPTIRMIGCASLTEASHGNACGVGLADVVTQRLAGSIDWGATRTNIVTSGFLLRGKLPVVADDDAQLWEFCLRGAGVRDTGTVRAVRIVDTLHCDEFWVSDVVLAELRTVPGFRLVRSGLELHRPDGSIAPFSS